MTMITPSYLGETIEYSSLHACRSTLEDPTPIEVAVALAYERPGLETRAARPMGERDEHFRLSAAEGAAHGLEIAHAAGSLEFAVNRKR